MDLPAVLEQLVADFVDLYCLIDGAAPAAFIPTLVYPERLTGDVPAGIPPFAGSQTAALLFTPGSTGPPQPPKRSCGPPARPALPARHPPALPLRLGCTPAPPPP